MKFFLRLRFNRPAHGKTAPAGLALTIMAASIIAGCSSSPSTSSQPTDSHYGHPAATASPTAPTPRIPAFFPNLESASPLPKVLDPSLFSVPVVARAYRYAQQNPEIFAQQPCYCYCDAGNGHRSLLDCFATDHSAGWQLCLKEGLLVDKLHKEGKSAAEIRESIIRGEWQSVNLE